MMRRELQSVLATVDDLLPEQLPELLGELEIIRTTALLKLSAQPAPRAEADNLLSIDEAAERLGMSTDYLYRHSRKLPFTRRMGRKLLFSSLGIDKHIRQGRP